MLETVKIRRAGFPVRRTFRDFYSRSVYQRVCHFCCCVPEHLCVYMFVHFYRYKIILKNKIHSDDEKQCCSDLLTLQDKDKQEWHLGKTKVQHACKVSHMHTCPNMFVSLVLDLHSCHRNHKCYADLTSSLILLKSKVLEAWNVRSTLWLLVLHVWICLCFSIIQYDILIFVCACLLIESHLKSKQWNSCRGCGIGSNVTSRLPLACSLQCTIQSPTCTFQKSLRGLIY